jgi:hypothetical protein
MRDEKGFKFIPHPSDARLCMWGNDNSLKSSFWHDPAKIIVKSHKIQFPSLSSSK